MSAAREPDQSDFDLERFVDMFDEALSSDDPRVVNALRQLMMMVILTKPETSQSWNDHRRGPLRRMMEDINHLHRRIETLEQRSMSDRESVKGYNDRMAVAGAQNMASQIAADQMKYAGVAKNIAQTINGGTLTKNFVTKEKNNGTT